jgi:hypothetical protein
MSEQLSLDVAPPRAYVCCGAPAPALGEYPPHFEHPHAEDCPNPNVGTWCDRYGRIFRRLHCITVRDGVECCPTGGRCPPDPRMVDPYNGACCLDLRRGAAA